MNLFLTQWLSHRSAELENCFVFHAVGWRNQRHRNSSQGGSTGPQIGNGRVSLYWKLQLRFQNFASYAKEKCLRTIKHFLTWRGKEFWKGAGDAT